MVILYDTTDADGNYSFTSLEAASYIITPKIQYLKLFLKIVQQS